MGLTTMTIKSPGSPGHRLLSMSEVAEHLGVSTRTVMRLIKSGAIAASRIGRQIRIAPQDLEAFRLAQRTK